MKYLIRKPDGTEVPLTRDQLITGYNTAEINTAWPAKEQGDTEWTQVGILLGLQPEPELESPSAPPPEAKIVTATQNCESHPDTPAPPVKKPTLLARISQFSAILLCICSSALLLHAYAQRTEAQTRFDKQVNLLDYSSDTELDKRHGAIATLKRHHAMMLDQTIAWLWIVKASWNLIFPMCMLIILVALIAFLLSWTSPYISFTIMCFFVLCFPFLFSLYRNQMIDTKQEAKLKQLSTAFKILLAVDHQTIRRGADWRTQLKEISPWITDKTFEDPENIYGFGINSAYLDSKDGEIDFNRCILLFETGFGWTNVGSAAQLPIQPKSREGYIVMTGTGRICRLNRDGTPNPRYSKSDIGWERTP